MATMKYDIPLLDQNTIFSLWQVKMRAILAQRDLDDALLGIDNMSSLWTAEEKSRKALSQIHLHLLNQILQDCLKETFAVALWRKLEQLCMTKSLTNKLHLKQRLYSHRMSEGTILEDHLTVFKEIVSDLESGIHGIYTCDSLTLDEVYDGLLSKEKVDKLVGGLKAKSESLVARGTPHERSSGGDSWGRVLQAANKNNRSEQKGKQLEKSGVADVVEDYSDGELLVASNGDPRSSEEWILDSSYTFHMCPNRDWFATYKTVSKGIALMGNNSSCKIAGYKYTGEGGVLKVNRGSLIVMKGIRRVASLYILHGCTVTGDATVASSSMSDSDVTRL
ncbi:hypothetical protein ZIOFF_030861 [Zingiber officinale]|uniref:Retrovirus-related Pol polyprotein from transposon TNT 1-94-like beta-barrel domain-containing protein n=1 Tax=Zingiber officinale TaxID=94328 RepID=A0A8J5GQ25_ZINOF|nr:hypothetical protein ZIOFF_030861 [Zingiber officinale]